MRNWKKCNRAHQCSWQGQLDHQHTQFNWWKLPSLWNKRGIWNLVSVFVITSFCEIWNMQYSLICVFVRKIWFEIKWHKCGCRILHKSQFFGWCSVLSLLWNGKLITVVRKVYNWMLLEQMHSTWQLCNQFQKIMLLLHKRWPGVPSGVFCLWFVNKICDYILRRKYFLQAWVLYNFCCYSLRQWIQML